MLNILFLVPVLCRGDREILATKRLAFALDYLVSSLSVLLIRSS